MDNYELIELLQREINKSTCDAKAEPQLVMALEKGLSFEDFMVSCDSLFFREYNKDIVFTEIKEDARKLSVLQLHLTRSGIYDHLPEGLFFQPTQSGAKNISAAEMAVDHRLNKQKEQEIRRFFMPFENDFFWQRVQLETEESRLLEGLKSGILNDYFMKFWGLSSSIPKQFIVPLILLLPYANKIAGDLSYTAQCLEELLQETVRVKKVTAAATGVPSYSLLALGKQQLGVDMVCGEQFIEDYPMLEFTIGPLLRSQVTDYLKGGRLYIFMQTFYRFFVPVGVGTMLNIEISTEKKNMHLEAGAGPVLGYSSFL